MSPIIFLHIISGLFTVCYGYYALRSDITKTKALITSLGLLVIAITGLFIRSFGSFSFLHIFSIVTLVSVFLYFSSKQELDLKVKNIVGPYIGLIIAFAFTMLPGRRLGNMVSEFSGSRNFSLVFFVILLIISILVTINLIKKYFGKR